MTAMSSPPAHRDGGPPHDDDEPSSPIGRHSPGIAHAFAASDRRRLTHKLDRRILPFILAAYLFQQLDKSTLMYASVFGLVDDAHLVGKQLSWLGSVLYLAQLVAQPAAAWVLVKFPLGKVIGTAILLWGMTLCLMSRCTTFGSLCFMRFVLGAFESIIGELVSCRKEGVEPETDQMQRRDVWPSPRCGGGRRSRHYVSLRGMR